MSAVSMATSVPALIDADVRANAGASFTPSPTIATRRPVCCSSATCGLVAGSTSAMTSSMPN